MTYVDGFVLAIPKDKIDAYLELANKAGKVWLEHGALEYKECLADDMDDKGCCITFPQLTSLDEEEETVVFSFIVFDSKEKRDEINAKVMEDPRMKDDCDPEKMPFDMKRMAYGGFNTVVEY